MPSIWAVTCVYVVVLGLCYPQVHVHLGGLCCQMKSWFCRGPGCYCGSCLTVWSRSRQAVCWCLWLLGPPWGDWSLDGHLRPCWCRRTLLLPGACWSGWPVLVFFFFEIYSQMCAGPSLVDLSFIIHRVRTCKEARKALWYGNLATHFLLNLTPLHIICSCEKSPIKQANFLSSKSAWCGFVGSASFIFETHGRKASGIEGTVNLCWCLFILLFLEMI